MSKGFLEKFDLYLKMPSYCVRTLGRQSPLHCELSLGRCLECVHRQVEGPAGGGSGMGG